MTHEDRQTRPPTAKPSLIRSFFRAVSNFVANGGTDQAAALTYYSVLSLFPAILAFTSLLGVFGNGQETTQALLDIAKDLGASEDVLQPVETFLQTMEASEGASLALAIGVGGALYSASNYVNGFSRAMNKTYGVLEGRPFLKLRIWNFALTLVMMSMVIVVAGALVLSGPFAEALGAAVGLEAEAVRLWGIAKWPVVVLIVMAIVALLYWATPNVRPKFRILSVGSVLAIVVWAVATAGFGWYVSSPFASYNATYGALTGLILLLLWLWITNIVMVIGAELDAELERSRELQAGVAAEESIQLPLRNSAGVAKKEAKQAQRVENMRGIRIKAAAGGQEAQKSNATLVRSVMGAGKKPVR